MKKLFLFLLLTASISVAFIKPAINNINIGDTMPKGDIKMKDVSGKIITLHEAKTAHGLMVMFSCNTCPYVIKNQSRTKEICAYATAKNIGVIVLNSNEANRNGEDSFEAMKKYAGQQNYNWLYAVDSNNEIADAFGANRTPECFLFDKDAKLVYHGAIDDSPADEKKVARRHLQNAIDEMADGKEVTIKESKSIGCGIKRKA
jgi:thioredoxin-related protein